MYIDEIDMRSIYRKMPLLHFIIEHGDEKDFATIEFDNVILEE